MAGNLQKVVVPLAKCVYHDRVKMFSRLIFDHRRSHFCVKRQLVHADGRQCIIDIRLGDDPCGQRYVSALKAIRIPTAVETFVMGSCDFDRHVQESPRFRVSGGFIKRFRTDQRMALHDPEFAG